MEDVNKYVDSVINHYKNDVPFMFDTVEQYVISVFRDKILHNIKTRIII